MHEGHIDIADCEATATRLLPGHIRDYIAGGAGEERVIRRNRTAFDELALRPRYLREPPTRHLATAMLGADVSAPVRSCSGGLSAEDAQDAVAAGASGILVSNHGGRIFDATLSSIEALPEIVHAVGKDAEVFLDGG
jgi:isopentenyl diphosphate isomerase/L-lactate dehydrogenase-like FMN-dependent dehydrogenase